MRGDPELAALLAALERLDRLRDELRDALVIQHRKARPLTFITADMVEVSHAIERLVWRWAWTRRDCPPEHPGSERAL